MQAVTSIMSTLGLKGKPSASLSPPYHPLNPLDIAEMTAAASAVDQYLRTEDSVQAFSRLWYKAVTLKEPPKAQLAPYLDSIAAGQQVDKLSRQVDVLVGAKRGKEAATWYGESIPGPQNFPISPPAMFVRFLV
jgi:Cu2+-containing amine oxidase